MLVMGILLLASTSSQFASVRSKLPERCSVSSIKGPTSDLTLMCTIISANIYDVLHEMKQPEYLLVGLGVGPDFKYFQFGDSAFHPKLQYLSITGEIFSISPDTFRGLNQLKSLYLSKHLNPDSPLHRLLTETDSTTYPPTVNYTTPLLGAGCLTPLMNLERLEIKESNISSFRVEEFCILPQLLRLDLSENRINSTEGLGISCNSSSCTTCLPNVTHLDFSGNPINVITIDISLNLPSLKTLNISGCNLSVLHLDTVAPESLEILDVSNNILNSFLISTEHPHNYSHLWKLWSENNQLQSLTPGVFLYMEQLKVVNLSRNALTRETLISAGVNSLSKLKLLDLSHNGIKTLHPAFIGNLTNLIIFKCIACDLSSIDNHTFMMMKNLQFLILNSNNLSTLEPSSFMHFHTLLGLDLSGNGLYQITLTENLVSMRVLDLSGNLLSEFPEFTGLWGNLSFLALNKNGISHIGPKQISHLTNLTFLSLAFNNIQFIPDQTFAKLAALKTLILSSNRIKTISEFGFYKMMSLTHLSLDNNLLLQLPPLKFYDGGSNLKFLNLSRNLIKTIKEIQFEYPHSFVGIDLSHNNVSELKTYLSENKHLQYVNYSYNQIHTLDSNSLIMQTLPRPKYYFQGNPLRIDCNSEWLLDTRLDKPYKQTFEDRRKVFGPRGKWLTFNESANDFYPKVISKYTKGEYYVKIADWDLLKATTPTGEHKFFSELTSEDFVCQYITSCYKRDCAEAKDAYCPCITFCSPECKCYTHSYNISINFMNCSSRNMTSLPSKRPLNVRAITLDGNFITSLNSSSLNFPQLQMLNASNSQIINLTGTAFINVKLVRILHLEQNNIEEINKETFAFLIYLEELYLQQNKIHHISKGSFDDLVELKTLWLHENNLKHLSLSVFERTYSLRELTLHDNPWLCDCQSGPAFKEWLLHSETVKNRLHIYCNDIQPLDNSSEYDSPNNSVANSTVSLLYRSVINADFTACTNGSVIEKVYYHTVIERSITEVVSLAVVFAVLVIFVLVIYKTRMLLRVWFYNKFGVHFHKEDDENDVKPYDIFIAYAKADERLVMHELLPNLEEGEISYKVCLECRDWPPGATTTDTVVASVQLSKRTIVIVSPQHLDTQWCEYSFDAAHYQMLKDKQIRLILVLTDRTLEARMTRAMKLYMKTNTFLVIGEKWFWEKLRYYMAVNPRGADYIVGREFRLMNAY